MPLRRAASLFGLGRQYFSETNHIRAKACNELQLKFVFVTDEVLE